MPYQRSGGKQCVVYRCMNNQKKIYEWKNSNCDEHKILHKDCACSQPFKFHCIPANDEKRRMWIKSLNRKDFNPSSKALVCSIHFVDGKPSKENPVPVLHMGHNVKAATPARRPLVKRSLNLPTPNKYAVCQEKYGSPPKSVTQDNIPSEILIATPLQTERERVLKTECESTCCELFPEVCQNKPVMVDACTQTVDVVALDHCYQYSKKTRTVSCQQSASEFSVENITTDSDSRFYTGLSLAVLFMILNTLSKYGKKLPYKLNIRDQIFAVLVRLRLGLTFHDLGRRLGVSTPLMGSIFQSWIDIMAKHLYPSCVTWLSRDTIRRSLPSSFQDSYPNTTCVIDCSEIFIHRPFQLKARAQTWSTYKNNNTGKFLIAIAPNGFIMFVSPLYGGRASDNYITKNSGFLDFLLPGDEVMSDRGFTISEEFCARRVKLNVPAFMKGRTQLSEQEVVDTRRIASVRIHVERAIMRMKSYRILNTKMSMKSLTKANKTVCVVAALCNLRDKLIKDNYDDE